MDPVICCLLGLCCPPFSPEQRDAFETQLTRYFAGDDKKAKDVADEIFDDFAKMTEKVAAAVRKAEKKE